ncbi:unnamed protein product [Meganyctiphanes norvegica]|uniref:Uncharacterized protein n=1 Tax=Meganyctiphanes norvegica TaxID=48144 RepID=A0AAV2QUN0_MEGNR
MFDQDSLVGNSLRKLLDPSTTPEKALQLFSSPWLLPEHYSLEDNEPIVICFAYIRFIIVRQPEADVDGIWEEILRKAVIYTKNYPGIQILRVKLAYAKDMHSSDVTPWFVKALSTYSKCPNPYTRLELLRLGSIFYIALTWANQTEITRELISVTIMRTISEIPPHHLYPSGKNDDILFNNDDLYYYIYESHLSRFMKNMIVADITKQIKEENKVLINSIETKFLCHTIQLLGMSAITTCYISSIDVFWYGDVLKDFISRPPFSHYIVESINDVTTLIINKYMPEVHEIWSKAPNLIWAFLNSVENIDVCNKTCDLPRLLLSRQIHGFRRSSQRSLLIPLLHPLQEYVKLNQDWQEEVSDDNGDIGSDEQVSDENSVNFEDLSQLIDDSFDIDYT